jgi:arabinogalactan endo-1,4-beta-galactosidase
MTGAWRRKSALLFGVLAIGGGCSSDTSSPSTPVPPPTFMGADLSSLERLEQAGAVFKDAGQPGDAIAILRTRGANLIRLRLFVSPNDSDVQVNDIAYTVQMAVRVKSAGARLLLDLHYSDTWADPGHQLTPAAWAGLALDSLAQQVESYSADVITQLKQANALPDIVQVGNEIDAGILWPEGQLAYDSDSTATWDNFTLLLKAGISGVRDALAPGDSVRIMLHYSQGGSAGGTQWFFDHLDAHGVPYDLIGLSYYPWWHGSLLDLKTNLYAAALRYGRDVMVVETSYPWRAGGWESMAPDRSAMIWPITRAGQAKFVRDVRDAVAALPNGHGAGVLWWYPESIEVPGLFVWGGGSLALFDDGGNALPAASGLDAR